MTRGVSGDKVKDWLTLGVDTHRSRPKAGRGPDGVSSTYVEATRSRTYESSPPSLYLAQAVLSNKNYATRLGREAQSNEPSQQVGAFSGHS